MDIMQVTGRHGLLTAIELLKAADAVPLGEAMLEGGLTVGEVTFRTEAAVQALRTLANTYPQMTVGAGSVVFVEQARQALEAGAKFIVSAGFNPELVDWCIANELPVLPGVATASELTMAMVRGLRVVKFFPAEIMGGIKGIQALSAPFPGMKFIPMGGVSVANMANYLHIPSVHAIGGSWPVHKKFIADGNYAEITRLIREALTICQDARGAV